MTTTKKVVRSPVFEATCSCGASCKQYSAMGDFDMHQFYRKHALCPPGDRVEHLMLSVLPRLRRYIAASALTEDWFFQDVMFLRECAEKAAKLDKAGA